MLLNLFLTTSAKLVILALGLMASDRFYVDKLHFMFVLYALGHKHKFHLFFHQGSTRMKIAGSILMIFASIFVTLGLGQYRS